MGTMDPVDYVKFVEIVSRDHETHQKKALELIRSIQDHFLMSLVQKFSGFRFSCVVLVILVLSVRA